MIRKTLLIVLAYGLYFCAAAQDFQWAKQLAGSSGFNVHPKSVCTDGNGNVYVTGYFTGTADFNPGTETNNLISNGGKDIFILKLDAGGNYVWAYNIGGTGDDEGVSISFYQSTPSSYLFVAGTYRLSVDFNPGTAVTNKTEAGSSNLNDIFFLTLTPDADFQFCSTLGNSQAETLEDVYMESAGVWATGSFSGTMSFASTTLTSNGGTDAFLMKGDIFSSIFWAQKIGGTGNDYGKAIRDGVVVGEFAGTVDFDPGAGNTSLTASGTDIFVFYYGRNNGSFLNVHKIGGTGNDVATSADKRFVSQASVNATNEYVISGSIAGATDFDPGAGTVSQTPTGGNDGFVVKYTRVSNASTDVEVSYTCNWANKIGATNNDVINDIAFDATGSIYYAASIGSGASSFMPIIGKYASAGTVAGFGGSFNPTPVASDNQSRGIYVAASGDVYTAGYFTGSTVDFDPAGGVAVSNLTAASTGQNGYVQKMSTCTAASAPTITATETTLCYGKSTVLSVSSGMLNGNNSWTWYRGGCGTGGTLVGTGNNITVTPSVPTTYYARGEGGCASASGSCSSGLSITVNVVPTVTSTTGGTRCGTGTVVISASPSIGTINWYTASSGGTLVGTGTPFTTPSISSATQYYAEAEYNGCKSTYRMSAMAAVWNMYTVTGTTPGARCGPGTVTLGASISGGNLNWYDSPTGGTSLGTTTTFTTPSITTTTTFYADVTNNICVSSPRVAVVATVNPIPSVTGTTPANRCGTGTVTLGATASAGTLNWYNSSSGGSSLGTGTSFTTPSISANTQYYVEALNNGCTSTSRTMVLATIKSLPTIISNTPGSRCGAGTVNLYVTPSAGTVSWHTTSSGNTYVSSGQAYTTPSLSATTTFYAETIHDGCVSTSRTAVTATVIPIPVVTGTSAATCGPGTVTLSASTTAGTLGWYLHPSTGSVAGTNTTFVTPTISTSTNYYVEAIFNGCTSIRIPVLAEVLTAPNLGITVSSPVLTAQQTGATYQWVDCNNANTHIAGATSQSYTATANGSYAVEVTIAGCAAQLSSCETITGIVTGVQEEELLNYFTCNNPVASELTIRYKQMPDSEVKITLYDLNGRLVKTIVHRGDMVNINMEGMESGMYILSVTMGSKEVRKRIVKIN